MFGGEGTRARAAGMVTSGTGHAGKGATLAGVVWGSGGHGFVSPR